ETKEKKGTAMNPLTHFKKIRILRNIFLSLGAIFALVTAAHAQNLYVSANVPGGSHAIFEYTPTGMQSTYATGLDNPRGLAFDSAGNLYAADGNAQTIYEFAPNGARTVFVGPSAFAPGESPVGLAFDSSGNLFVSIETFTDPGADSIVYFSPTRVKSTFATGLTTPRGLAFDSLGNLFVAEAGVPEIPGGDILEFPTAGGQILFSSGFGRPEFLTFGPPR